MKYKRVPTFYGFRIYFISTLIYVLLVTPILAVIYFKYVPELIEKGRLTAGTRDNATGLMDTTVVLGNTFELGSDSLVSDSLRAYLNDSTIIADSNNLAENDTVYDADDTIFISPTDLKDENARYPLSDSLNLLFARLLIISFFVGFVFNYPFKRYFKRKRKGKKISKKLFNFCKKYLLYTPQINAGIFFLSFGITVVYMFVILISPDQFSDPTQKKIFQQFFFVSLISSILTIFFIYFWQKHRVHIKYLEHIYTPEELRKRIFNFKVGKIRNRFIISSTMTTLLPLTVVVIYLFLSLSAVADLGDLTDDQVGILLGDYATIFNENSIINQKSMLESLFYVNAINNILMFMGIISGIFISFVYIIFYVRWTTQDIVSPVKELLYNMKLTGEGKMNTFGIVRTNDEIGQLTEGYNEMSQKIKDYITNISRMNTAYSRFVPQQFLDFLEKESFVDIKLGDQVQKEMTILFSDIRGFTEISEEMTPKENFDYLNHYLGYMEPVIRNNNGFIDKYMGDSIMALFPENPGDAINAAIEMRIKLSQFNQVMGQFGKPEIDSGIGIHIGSLMLGVVGGEGRMDGTVISDAVNLASRLENLTKLYGNSIIISEDTLIKLDDPSAYHYRFLDVVIVKGKKEAVYVFEIIEGEAEDIKRLKIQTKNQFAKGINHYKKKEFKEAAKDFKEILKININDKAADLYLQRCEKILKHGLPDNWDGILTMETKY